MPNEYPKKYWWIVLVAVPVTLAIIQLIPHVLGDRQSRITEIRIIPSRLTLQVNESAVLRAEARSSSGVIRDNIELQWECVNRSIASVSPTGNVTALKEGSTTVIAKGNGVTGIAELTVKPVSGTVVPPSREPVGDAGGSGEPVPAKPLEDRTAMSRAEVEKLVSLGVDYMSRGDVSFVLARARLPFFFAGALIPTRDRLNTELLESAAAIRKFTETVGLVRVHVYQVRTLRGKDWFPRVTSFVPLAIEDEDWAGLIVLRVRDRPSIYLTYVAFFRLEEGEWKLTGVSGGEGLLE